MAVATRALLFCVLVLAAPGVWGAVLFTDDFEAAGWDASNWDATRGTAAYNFGAVAAPGGRPGLAGFLDHGGYNPPTAPNDKHIGLNLYSRVAPAATAAKATTWFYDASPNSAKDFHVCSHALVGDGGNYIAGLGRGNGAYYFGGGIQSLNNVRTAGWHKLEVYYTDSGAWPVIDGVDYSNPSNCASGSAFDTIASCKLHNLAGFYPTSQADERFHFDDVVVEDITPPAGLVAQYDWEGHVAPSATQALIDKALPGRSDLFVRMGSPQAVPFRDGTGGLFNRTGTGTNMGDSIAGDNPELHITGALTLSAWIQPTQEAIDATAASGAYVVTKYGGGGTVVGDQRSYALGLADGKLNFIISPDGSYGTALDLSSIAGLLEADRPYHITGVFEPGVRQEIYVNGVRVQDQGGSTVPSQIFDSTTWFRVGCMFGGWFSPSSPGDVNHFDGVIDDVQVYNRALSGSEVTALSGFATPGLVAHYDWDQPLTPTTTTPLLDKAGPDNSLLYVRKGSPQMVPFRGGKGGLFNRNGTASDAGDSIAYDSPELHVTGALTLTAWIQPTQEAIDASGGAYVVTRYGGGTGVGNERSYALGLWGGEGQLDFALSQDGSYNASYDLLTSLPPSDRLKADEIYHIAAVFEPDVKMEIYLGGALVASRYEALGQDVPSQLFDCTSWFRIGAMFGGWYGPAGDVNRFDGIIGDVRVYDRALSSAELYRLAVPEPCTLALVGLALAGLARRRRR